MTYTDDANEQMAQGVALRHDYDRARVYLLLIEGPMKPVQKRGAELHRTSAASTSKSSSRDLITAPLQPSSPATATTASAQLELGGKREQRANYFRPSRQRFAVSFDGGV